MPKKFSLSLITTAILFTTPAHLGLHKAYGDTSAQNTDQTLSKLEDRFFEHEYSTDTDTDRINRLEKFVFGCTQTGSINDRLQHIMSTIPDDTTDKIVNAASQTSDTDTSDSGNNQQISTTSTDQSQDTSNSTDDNQQVGDAPTGQAFDYSSYPSVTSLEQELLGHTYTNDPLARRLARLETKAFGAPSTSNDLSQRTDNLENYEQRNNIYGDRTIAGSPPTNSPAIAPIRPWTKHNKNVGSDNTTTDDSTGSQDNYSTQPGQYVSKTG